MAKLEIGNFLVKTIFFFFEKDFGEKECPFFLIIKIKRRRRRRRRRRERESWENLI